MDEKKELVASVEEDTKQESNESLQVEKESTSKSKDDSYVSEWLLENRSAQSIKKGILLKTQVSSSDTNLEKRSTLSKIFNWDPWLKIRRKSKKNKKKNALSTVKVEYDSSDSSNCNVSTYSYGEPNDPYVYRDASITREHDRYKYELGLRKKVQFQTNVRVIHFDAEHVLSDTVEPLKKELDQQLRNIRLRKEKASEALDVIQIKPKKSVSNYMSAWRKK